MDDLTNALEIYRLAQKVLVESGSFQASGYSVARRRVRRYDRIHESRIISVVPFKIEFLSPDSLVCVFRQDLGICCSATESKADDKQILIRRGKHKSPFSGQPHRHSATYCASMIERFSFMVFDESSTYEYSDYDSIDHLGVENFLGESCYRIALKRGRRLQILWISKSQHCILRIIQTDIDCEVDRVRHSDWYLKVGRVLMFILFWFFIMHDFVCAAFNRYDLILITDSFPYVEVEHVFTSVQIAALQTQPLSGTFTAS